MGRRARASRRRWTTRARGSLPASPVLLLALGLWACAHTADTVPPYRDDPVAAQQLADRARSSCVERTGQVPPKPFVTDGCSAFTDGDWLECCVQHDVVYWCGGSSEGRKQADERLEQCVADLGHVSLASLMYSGVRAGGVSWMPLPWRWGFGWDFPDDGDPGARSR